MMSWFIYQSRGRALALTYQLLPHRLHLFANINLMSFDDNGVIVQIPVNVLEANDIQLKWTNLISLLQRVLDSEYCLLNWIDSGLKNS